MGSIALQDIRWTYVNLESRPDRDAEIRKELSCVGISADRFDACTGEQYTGPKAAVANYAKPGQIGCMLSHVTIAGHAAKQKRGIVGVFEDDAILCNDFVERLRYIESNFNEPWDIFFLGSTFHPQPTWHKDTLGVGKDFELTRTRHIVRAFGTWNTYAYLLNCQSAGRVLDLLWRNMHRSLAIDHLLILIQPELQCFCFTPGMAIQRDGWSDITKSHSTFSLFLPLGPHIWAERLSDFDWDSWVETVPAVSRGVGGVA